MFSLTKRFIDQDGHRRSLTSPSNETNNSCRGSPLIHCCTNKTASCASFEVLREPPLVVIQIPSQRCRMIPTHRLHLQLLDHRLIKGDDGLAGVNTATNHSSIFMQTLLVDFGVAILANCVPTAPTRLPRRATRIDCHVTESAAVRLNRPQFDRKTCTPVFMVVVVPY